MTAAAAIGAAAVVSMTAACAPTGATTNPAGSAGSSGQTGPARNDGNQTAAPAIKPGLTGKAIVLATNASFSGDDAVTDA